MKTIQIKTLMNLITKPLKWPNKLKRTKNTTVNQDMQQLELSYTAVGNVNLQNHFCYFFKKIFNLFFSFIYYFKKTLLKTL